MNRVRGVHSVVLSISALIGVVLLFQAQAMAQQERQIPFAGTADQEPGYPSGERVQPQYETIPGGTPMPGFRATMTESAVGFATAAEIQPGLPEGFGLREGRTSHVLQESPQPAVPGVKSKDAQLDTPPGMRARGKYITNYSLEYQGVPLAKGSDYLAIVSEDGRLLATRQRGVPTEVDGTTPTVSAEGATRVAQEDAASAMEETDLQVVDRNLEIWVDEDRTGRLSWRVVLESPDRADPKGRQYWISAIGEPEVVHWETTIFHTHFGTSSGNVWEASPLGATENQPLSGLQVNRTGAGGGNVVTGPDGRYGFTTGTGNATVDTTLVGPRAAIQNMAGAVMQVNKSGPHANSIDLNFGASAEFELSQVSAFYWTNLARQLSQHGLAVDPHYQVPTRVNLNQTCNAYYSLADRSINFFQAGGPCPNTAYSDVVLHEYGHYVDHANGGILDGGLSEGISDTLAVIGTRQPCLGRDFTGAGTCLRPATDLIMWPPAPGEGVHARGRRYAGFAWELVEQLKTSYGEDAAFDIAKQLVIATFAANPSSIPDAVHVAFLLDDDDGDLTNGTPHFKQLAAAADSRKLPRPADPVPDMAVAASAQFPWIPVKKVSTNSNILQAQIELKRPTTLHISANSSARTSGAALMFRTGFLNQPQPNVMWTNSLRNVTVQTGQWANFGSKFSINLPTGTHTIYWKIWVSGGELEFSSGSLFIEGFSTPTAPFGVAAIEPVVSAFEGAVGAAELPADQHLDERDPQLTVVE